MYKLFMQIDFISPVSRKLWWRYFRLILRKIDWKKVRLTKENDHFIIMKDWPKERMHERKNKRETERKRELKNERHLYFLSYSAWKVFPQQFRSLFWQINWFSSLYSLYSFSSWNYTKEQGCCPWELFSHKHHIRGRYSVIDLQAFSWEETLDKSPGRRAEWTDRTASL